MSPRFETLPEGKVPARIVSLVPSITESLFALGFSERVVGVTEWCVHPKQAVASLPKVGGTKDADVAAIVALAPDLVIANHEENTHRVVRQLDDAGLDVWVTYPRTVREGALLLVELTRLLETDEARDDARERVALPVLRIVTEAERAQRSRGTGASAERPRVFCPIWRDPWMTAGPDTYVNDMIALCGGLNVHPISRDVDPAARRYPKLSLTELVELAPDVILLPDEPYAFGEEDAAELARLDVPAARTGRIHLIDGTWVSWYGPRIGVAVPELSVFRAAAARVKAPSRPIPLKHAH